MRWNRQKHQTAMLLLSNLKSQTEAIQILLTIATNIITVEIAKEPIAIVGKLLLCKRYHQDHYPSLSFMWTERLQTSHLGKTSLLSHRAIFPSIFIRGTLFIIVLKIIPSIAHGEQSV